MSGAVLPTKAIFLAQNVVPANDNDAFNDNKCTFCWGPYDDAHPGVRILPCNHVFGRDCLPEIINAPKGDHCPICRTALFRPPHRVAIERAVLPGAGHLLLLFYAIDQMIVAFMYKVFDIAEALTKAWIAFEKPLTDFAHALSDASTAFTKASTDLAHALTNILPEWLRPWAQRLGLILSAWVNANNIYWHADMLVTYCTNLRARNPEYSLEEPKKYVSLYLAVNWLLRYWYSGTDCAGCRVASSIVMLSAFLLWDLHGRFTSHRDRLPFATMMALAFVTHGIVTFVMVPDLCHACEAEVNYSEGRKLALRVMEGALVGGIATL
jgi:hypothetical protein